MISGAPAPEGVLPRRPPHRHAAGTISRPGDSRTCIRACSDPFVTSGSSPSSVLRPPSEQGQGVLSGELGQVLLGDDRGCALRSSQIRAQIWSMTFRFPSISYALARGALGRYGALAGNPRPSSHWRRSAPVGSATADDQTMGPSGALWSLFTAETGGGAGDRPDSGCGGLARRDGPARARGRERFRVFRGDGHVPGLVLPRQGQRGGPRLASAPLAKVGHLGLVRSSG